MHSIYFFKIHVYVDPCSSNPYYSRVSCIDIPPQAKDGSEEPSVLCSAKAVPQRLHSSFFPHPSPFHLWTLAKLPPLTPCSPSLALHCVQWSWRWDVDCSCHGNRSSSQSQGSCSPGPEAFSGSRAKLFLLCSYQMVRWYIPDLEDYERLKIKILWDAGKEVAPREPEARHWPPLLDPP